METITKNGKEYLRFKIGDQFEAISGKGSFNKMKKEGIASDHYDEEKGFVYPFYDGSTINNHIKGYAKKFNFSKPGIKVSMDGDAGKSKFIKGNIFIGDHCYILQGQKVDNYISSLLNSVLPKYKQGTTIPAVKFSYCKDAFIEIPANHQELSKVIARVLEYKQLSKQLSKQFKDYKQAILQEANKAIEIHKQNGNHDKYISFKIGDEFKAISGKGSFNKMKKEGLASDYYDEEKGFVYPVYTSQVSNNHIVGFCSTYNSSYSGIKVSSSGMVNAGRAKYIGERCYLANDCYLMYSKKMDSNSFLGYLFDNLIPKYKQGTAMPHANFPYFKDASIFLPLSHNLLANKIKQINHWETIVNQTTKQMETYIDGVLQMSLK